MKFYLYIFLLLMLQSCFVNKDVIVDSYLVNENINDLDSLQVEKDTISITYPIIVSQKVTTENKEIKDIKDDKKIETIYNIINYVDTTKLLDNSFGIIAYNVPQSFKVNKYSTIKLRISRDKKEESVVVGNRNIPIVGTNSNDNIILETIKIDEYITAKLYTDDGVFEVDLISSDKQRISDDGYTEWIWRVRPLKSGTHYIKMIISISEKDIVVYEKNIEVESDFSWSFSTWFIKWWQVIMTTIITPILIPLIIWIWKKRKSE
jgi:hypothetical protein